MDLKLTGKTAIVTGGGRGIGRGIAVRLAAEGATVVVPDLTAEDAEKVVAEIVARGGAGMALQANAADEKKSTGLSKKPEKLTGTSTSWSITWPAAPAPCRLCACPLRIGTG